MRHKYVLSWKIVQGTMEVAVQDYNSCLNVVNQADTMPLFRVKKTAVSFTETAVAKRIELILWISRIGA